MSTQSNKTTETKMINSLIKFCLIINQKVKDLVMISKVEFQNQGFFKTKNGLKKEKLTK